MERLIIDDSVRASPGAEIEKVLAVAIVDPSQRHCQISSPSVALADVGKTENENFPYNSMGTIMPPRTEGLTIEHPLKQRSAVAKKPFNELPATYIQIYVIFIESVEAQNPFKRTQRSTRYSHGAEEKHTVSSV